MKNLYAALAAIQYLFLVEKRNNNSALGNAKYADYADIRAALDPRLKEHGIAISFRPGAMRRDGDAWVQSLTLTVCHLASGETDSATGEFPLPEGNRGVNFSQRYGSALTYSKRYMLTAFFGIITGDDDDARRAREIQERSADAPPKASGDAHWVTLMDGAWKAVAAPDWGTLGEMDIKELARLWESNPANPSLCAWMADRFYNRLEELGMLWAEFREKAGGTWPEEFRDCTPGQIKQAAITAKSMKGAQP